MSAHEVRAAVAERESDAQATMLVRPSEAKPQTTSHRPQATGHRPPGPSRLRRRVTGAIVLVVAAAVAVGLYAGSRQFWFIGTNDRGALTLYQGMPYDLPLGIHLYTKNYASSVPASAVPRHQLDAFLNTLKTKSDARGLLLEKEREYTHP